jgi:hypothetical protein
MPDADVPITAGSGTKIDTRTVGPGTDEHRQVVVIGDPTTAANVATVDASGQLRINATALPLPSDASTETTLASLNGKLPSTSALADGASNPTISRLGVFGKIFNGSTWDRIRSIGGLPAADANTGIQAVATVPHKTGYAQASATARYTTTQTSTILGPTVGASQKAVVTSVQIQAEGTTAASVQIYFGTGAYSRGTTRAIFDGHFVPSGTSSPGYAQSPSVPYEGTTNGSIRVTTSAAITLTVTAWYYLVSV